MRIAITGPARCGKSTLSRELATEARIHSLGLRGVTLQEWLPDQVKPSDVIEPAPRLCTDPAHLVKEPEQGVEYVPTSAVLPTADAVWGRRGGKDDLVWSRASQHVADHFLTRPGPWVLDGVGLPRALRKWLRAQFRADVPTCLLKHGATEDSAALTWARNRKLAPPFDRLIIMTQPKVAQKPGQVAQGKGLLTVLAPMLPWLQQHVPVEQR